MFRVSVVSELKGVWMMHYRPEKGKFRCNSVGKHGASEVSVVLTCVEITIFLQKSMPRKGYAMYRFINSTRVLGV